MPITHKIYSSRSLNIDSATYVGEAGRLFYEQTTGTGVAPVLKYSDGSTIGGLPISGSSLTFSSPTPPVNPHDGLLWWNNLDGRLYIYYDSVWVDASPESNSTTTGITLTMLSIGTSTAIGGGALSYDNTIGVFTYHPADLSSYATQTYVNSQGFITTSSLSVTPLASGTNALTYNNGVFTFTPVDLSSYATQTYVNSQGFITVGIFTTTNVSTFVNDAHYLQAETGVHSVTGTANQVIVADLGNRDIQLSTPQNLNSTATVTFGNLTVNNLNVLNTLTSVVPAVVDGYRIYLASTSTQDTQIDSGGIVLGTSTWQTSILYNLTLNRWEFSDSTGLLVHNLNASVSTITNLTVVGNTNLGYANLSLDYPNAPLQIDGADDSYVQVIIQNHSSGTNASSDFIATNDIGNDASHFIDMGINSSLYSTSSWVINGANDGYLYVDSGNLAIGTTATEIVTFIGPADTTDSIISVANASTITYSVDLMPSVDAVYQLGRPGQRWKGIYVGTGSVWINDISLGTDAELTVDNGVLYVNGAYQLQVGQLKFFENTIESTTGGTDIQIGLTTSTANLVLNRNVILATGKTFGLQDQLAPFTTSTLSVIGGILTVSNAAGIQAGQIQINNNVIESTAGGTDIQIGLTTSTANLVLNRNTVIAQGKSLVFGTGGLQTVAWNSTATVLWDQITGAPNVTGYTGSFGTTGYTGSAGANGTNGTNGYTGSFGTNGYTGSFGTTGYTGSASTIAGSSGYTGSIGYTGSVGAYGSGTGIDQSQYYVTTSTRTVSNGANKIVSLFGVGAAVSSSTRYMFNVAFDVTNGPNNDQLLFNITGTSVLSRVTVYSYSTIGGAHQLPIYTTVTSAFTTGINMNGGNNSNNGTEYTTIINGFIDVASAGTVNPSFGFVSVGSNVVVQPNAFMKIWPVSANTTTNSIIGTWS